MLPIAIAVRSGGDTGVGRSWRSETSCSRWSPAPRGGWRSTSLGVRTERRAACLCAIGRQTGVGIITSWKGTVQNRRPEENDEVSWLGKAEQRDLNHADKSHLTVLVQILRAK